VRQHKARYCIQSLYVDTHCACVANEVGNGCGAVYSPDVAGNKISAMRTWAFIESSDR
jgi:hypothetical protein